MNTTAQIVSLSTPSAGREVQDGIRRVEGSIDDILSDTAMLMSRTLRAGTIAGLAPAFSQRALRRQAEMIEAGMKLRELAFTAHNDLRFALRRVDTEVVGWGDMGSSPKAFADDPLPEASTGA